MSTSRATEHRRLRLRQTIELRGSQCREMPSDAVTIVVALAAPTAAGAVGVALHRQRLSHERWEGDLAVVRELLARGAQNGMQLERAADAWLGGTPPAAALLAAQGDPSVQALESAVHEWETYVAALQVVFDEQRAVVSAAVEVEAVAVQLLHELEGPLRDRWDISGRVVELANKLKAWRAAARDVARARL